MFQRDRNDTTAHRHASMFGYPFPPMAGGAPDEDPDGGTPSPEAQLGVEPPALPFSYDDIPETLTRAQATEFLRAREAQMQSGFTKAVQSALDVKKQAEGAMSLQARLEAEESRREAITELLAEHGLEIDWPEEGVEPAATDDDDDDVEDLQFGTDPELVERLDRIEQRFQSEDEKAQRQAWMDHVTANLGEFAKREKISGGVEAIPDEIRSAIVGQALALPRLESGLLDMAEAINRFDVQREAIAKAAREGYLGSKDTPTITIGGGSADPHQDLSTERNRLDAAMKIAQRHLG